MSCALPVLGKCLFHIAARIATQGTVIGENVTRVHAR